MNNGYFMKTINLNDSSQHDLIHRTFERFLKNQNDSIFVDQVLDTIEMNIKNKNSKEQWLEVFKGFDTITRLVKSKKRFNFDQGEG